MRRREFLMLAGGAATIWPIAGISQSLPVVGYIHVLSEAAAASTTSGFRKGLSEAGFFDGHNVAFEYRYAGGRSESFESSPMTWSVDAWPSLRRWEAAMQP